MSTAIDFDTHVYEPLSVWTDYLDPKFRDRSPQWTTYGEGSLGVEVGGKLYPSVPNHPGMAKIYADDSKVDRSGNDPAVRLKWMDERDVDVHVIFPTLGMHGFSGSVQDAALAGAFSRAYNRYMAEYVATDPRRLRGAMIVPANHPEVAAEEMRWAKKNKLDIVYLNPSAPGEIPWSHPSRDPMWRTAEELGLVITFHESTTGCPPNATGIHRYSSHWSMVYYCTHVVEASLAMTDVILGGTLERFPKLRIGAAEAHIHWVAGWMAFMDQQFGTGQAAVAQSRLCDPPDQLGDADRTARNARWFLELGVRRRRFRAVLALVHAPLQSTAHTVQRTGRCPPRNRLPALCWPGTTGIAGVCPGAHCPAFSPIPMPCGCPR